MNDTATPFAEWTRDDGRLLKTSLSRGQYDRIPAGKACHLAQEAVNERIESQDAYAIPLFEPEAPIESDAFVAYRADSDEVKFFDSGDTSVRWVSTDVIATTELGQRLQWWLPRARDEFETLDEERLPPSTVTALDSLSDDEADSLFSEMHALVREERDTQKRENRDKYTDLGLEKAIETGAVSGPFLPLGDATYEGNRVYKFSLGSDEGVEDGLVGGTDEPDLRDDAEIFKNNLYLAGMEGQSDQFPIEVESVWVGDSDLWLRPIERVRAGSALDKALADENGILWLHDLLNPVPFERRHNALDSVQKSRNKRQLLTGNRQLHFEADRHSVPDPPLQLNDSQEQAFIWAKAAEDCLCIHGPPGTGKTRTLTAFIRAAVAQGDRVLVTAHSNQAVDNLLVGDSTVEEPEPDTLHAMAQSEDSDFSIARAGSNSENAAVTQYYDSVSTQAADVVAATTSGAAQFKSSSFDVAVVDEATQASRAATTIAMSVSQKLVLAGDHKQLPPYSASDDILGDDQRLSLFETLLDRYGDDIAVMLKTQYRMNEEIVAFPNAEFYSGDLSTAEQNRDWTVDDLSPLMGIDIHGPEREQAAGHSYYNEAEAEAAAKQVKLLTNSGLDPSDIGIIAAYSAQVDEIRQRVRRLDIAGVHRVAVLTVDSFQGSECEAVIVSLTRSNDRAASGFLTIPDEGPRRLNVALTRARKRLVIIADWDTLGEQASFRDRDETCADLYARLASHIRQQDKMLDKRRTNRT